MALCEQCGNFDDQEVENDYGIFHLGKRPKRRVGYQPDLYFYWHGDIEEDYDMGDYDCLCEICFEFLLAVCLNKINKFIFIPTECIL